MAKGLIISIMAIVMVSCAAAPVPTPPQTPIDHSRQGSYLEFWSLYTGPHNDAGVLNNKQQVEMIAYFCVRSLDQFPVEFTQAYGNIDQCSAENAERYAWTKETMLDMVKWPNYKDTIGYYCMHMAATDYCQDEIGFCYWDALWSDYADCVNQTPALGSK